MCALVTGVQTCALPIYAQAAVLLGDIAARTYQRWKQGEYGRWNVDLAARLSNLIGIHKALRLLYTETDRGYRWIQAPNRAFGDRSALEIMLGGQLTDRTRTRMDSRHYCAHRSQYFA